MARNKIVTLATFLLLWLLCAPYGAGQDFTDLKAELESITQYRYGDSRKPLLFIEESIGLASKDPELRRSLLQFMEEFFGRSYGTLDAKRYVCRQLGLVGTAKQVPLLAALLDDKDLAGDARASLERIPGEASLAALRVALPRAEGTHLVGLINSLGERRDAGAVMAIGKFLNAEDPEVPAAALEALGKIGGEEALKLLLDAEKRLPGGNGNKISHALFGCACRFRASSEPITAASIFGKLLSSRHPRSVRIGSYLALLAMNEGKAVQQLEKALSTDDEIFHGASIQYIQHPERQDLLKVLLDKSSSFPAQVQDQLATMAISRHDVDQALLERIIENGPTVGVRYFAFITLLERSKKDWKNMALGAAATSPDDLEMDGTASGDTAGIDGDPDTYWDEVNGQSLYRYKVSFPSPCDVSALAITGYNHHDYAPKDFEVLLDDRVVRKVRDAGYVKNKLWVFFKKSRCRTLELKITGYYGLSPAIRELELFDAGELAEKGAALTPPVENGSTQRSAIPDAEYERIESAVSSITSIAPEKPRRLLVFSISWGYKHSAIPYGKVAFELMAKQTGAFEAIISDDPAMFEKEKLATFDAVVFNNTNNEIFLPENFEKLPADEKKKALTKDARLKKNLVDFLHEGKGLAVTHAGVASFRNWPEFGEIVGARFDNHPWNAGSKVTLKVDDPGHPVSRAFREAEHLEIADEIYQLKENYSRDKVRVLASLDMDKTAVTPAQQKLIHRDDNDIPISYVKSYGEGRIFYCALGHQHDLFWNPVVLKHYLDGIQFALGDLAADTTPSSRASKKSAAPSFTWSRRDDGVTLLNRGQAVWKIRFDKKLGKSYFHPVGLADGTPLTWLSPPDHTWHRALWFSWKFINGVNYWEYVKDMGLSELVDVRTQLNADFSACFELKLIYHPPGKSVVMKEKRVITVHAPDRDGRYAIDWNCAFESLDGALVLNRTPPPGEPDGQSWGGYSGMSVRLAKETAGWRIMDSEGRSGMECHGQPARWIGCEFVQTDANREAGIVILDHPGNLRHPAPTFIVLQEDLPFVYYSPALLFNESYTLLAGERLNLKYRILVYPGRAGKGHLDAEWKNYAAR